MKSSAASTPSFAFLAPGQLRPAVAAALVALVATGVFANTLGNAFVWDDAYNVVANPAIRSFEGVLGLFSSSVADHSNTEQLRGMNSSYWRPLTIASYALEYALFGLRPAVYHATNVLLHGAASLLVLALGMSLFSRPEGGVGPGVLLGALLFAVHPLHTEAVCVVTYRSDLLAGLAVLGGLLLWVRGSQRGGAVERRAVLLWVPLVYAAGLCSKEMAVSLPLLVVLWDLSAGAAERRPLWQIAGRAAPLLLLLGGYLLVRSSLLSPSKLTFFGQQPGSTVALTMLSVFALYLRLLVWPWPLNPFYDWAVLPFRHSPLDPMVLLGGGALVGFCAAIWVAWRRGQRGVLLCLASLLLILLPVSQLVPIIVAAGERFLYAAIAGPCLLAGLALERAGAWTGAVDVGRLRGKLVALAAVAILIVFGALTVLRNHDWRSDRAVLEANVKDFPRSQNARVSLARLDEREGRLRAALRVYQQLGLTRAAARVRVRLGAKPPQSGAPR
jgi:hypothetical protein